MTPKEKANDIVKKYWMKNKNGQDSYGVAVQNSIICVEEIQKEVSDLKITMRFKGCVLSDADYWREVKSELEKI